MKNTYNIVILEDDIDFANIIKRILNKSNYRLNYITISSIKAFATLVKELKQDSSIDIILLDLNLIDSNGIDTLENVIKLCPETAVVVLTGEQEEDQGILSIQLGAQDFISKDKINDHNMKRIIKYAIERQRLKNQVIKKKSSEEIHRSILDIEKYVGGSLAKSEVKDAYKRFLEIDIVESKYNEVLDRSIDNIAKFNEIGTDLDKEIKKLSLLLKDSGLDSKQFIQMHQSMIREKLKSLPEKKVQHLQSASSVTLLKLASSFLG